MKKILFFAFALLLPNLTMGVEFDNKGSTPKTVLVKLKHGAHLMVPRGFKLRNTFDGDPRLLALQVPLGTTAYEMAKVLSSRSEIEFAEPDFSVRLTDTTPDDSLWAKQWDMVKISSPSAWDIGTDSSAVIVAVVDTGIDFEHPDLVNSLWKHPKTGEHGYSATGGRLSAGGQDDQGHGTHVAGTIGATGNNTLGIAGLNWKVQMISLKFLNKYGSGNVSDAILLLDQVVKLKNEGINIRLTNNSWGSGEYSQALKEAFDRVEASGILNIAAAGNDASHADLNPLFPSAFESRSFVSVLASNKNDLLGYFSNFGLAATDIAAPGVDTLSTVPKGSCSLCDPTGYKVLSGTSMASPHVAGVAAALFARFPQLSYLEARDVLLDPKSFDPLNDAHASDSSTGGRLNMYKVLTNPLAQAPKLNRFPIILAAPNLVAEPETNFQLHAEAQDPDGDVLRSSLVRLGKISEQWLYESLMADYFPSSKSSKLTMRSPGFAIPSVINYLALFADGRGGSVRQKIQIKLNPKSLAGRPPIGQLTANPIEGPVGTKVEFKFDVVDPEGGPTKWDITTVSSGGTGKQCCSTTPSHSEVYSRAGVYRVNAQAIDSEMLVSDKSSVVIRIGGSKGEPPLAIVQTSSTVGQTPLRLKFDLSGSTDLDGKITQYRFNCQDGAGDVPNKSPSGECLLKAPGPYALRLMVGDNDGNWDAVYVYAMAL